MIRSDVLTQINCISEKLYLIENSENFVNDTKLSDKIFNSHNNVSIFNSDDNVSKFKNKNNSKITESEITESEITKSEIIESEIIESDVSESEIIESDNSKSSKTYKIINSRNLNKTSDESVGPSKTENKIEKLNIKNKRGNIVKSIKDIFSDDIKINTENSDSEKYNFEKYNSDKNGYFEINDNVDGYSNFLNNNNYKKLSPIENSFQTNNKSVSVNNKEPSYNPNSAILNAKIYKINI